MELEKLKSLLGIQGEEKDNILRFIVDDVKETITNFCHVDQIPPGLEQTAYRMAIDLYRAENFGFESGSEAIKSISQGDTSVSLGMAADVDFKKTILKNYEKQLKKYRRIRW